MADGSISILVEDNGISTALQRKLSYLLDDWEVQEGVTKIIRDEMNKFVPRRTGNLARSVDVTGNEIIWTSPYAHYQYMGFVYGPNFPIVDEDGNQGWRSRKGKEKHPTGNALQYHTPGTGSFWDQKLMDNSTARRIMNIRITNYLKRMAKEKDL